MSHFLKVLTLVGSVVFYLQTDRAAMIDEIVDYVKFLRLQVKVTYLVVCFTITDLDITVFFLFFFLFVDLKIMSLKLLRDV